MTEPQQERSAADDRPSRPSPFGMRRRNFIIARVAIAVGIVIIGVTLHHHGPAYDVIRGVYLVAIVALIVWRIHSRRARRR